MARRLSRILTMLRFSLTGGAINGKVSMVSGANLDQVTDIVVGLPVSDHDHAVNGLEFGDAGELYILVGASIRASVGLIHVVCGIIFLLTSLLCACGTTVVRIEHKRRHPWSPVRHAIAEGKRFICSSSCRIFEPS
jgi:hypothetical protein